MFSPSDSETFWLNTTNLVLGLVTLGALVAIGYAVIREVVERVRVRANAPVAEGPHTFLTPELGLTMADGGEPVEQKPKSPAKNKK